MPPRPTQPIPFNRPHVGREEYQRIEDAARSGVLSGNGEFAGLCTEWLEQRTGAARAFLTPSCTAALEMSAMLAGIGPGDEVIMPSFTFVSTANAFALRGGVPVFAEIDGETLNLDPAAAEAAVTDRTKAVCPVHYAGVGCDMDAFRDLCDRRGLVLIEDAAQGILATSGGRALGAFGQLGAISFHETKNIHCGEGGALLVNDPGLVETAEVIQEKGTNRSRFFRGEIDKYSWVGLGSSYLLSELGAAFLWAQLEKAEELTERRLRIWLRYHEAFEEPERQGLVRRPVIPPDTIHNAHLYHLLLPEPSGRTEFIAALGARGVQAVFHYVPLHTSPAGLELGRAAGDLRLTDSVSARLVRLPLWVDLSDEQIETVIDASLEALRTIPVGEPVADG